MPLQQTTTTRASCSCIAPFASKYVTPLTRPSSATVISLTRARVRSVAPARRAFGQ